MSIYSYFNIFLELGYRDSCQRGWRLFSIVAAYFECSEALKPYLFKYLETAAYDKRRAYHGKRNFFLKTFFFCIKLDQIHSFSFSPLSLV